MVGMGRGQKNCGRDREPMKKLSQLSEEVSRAAGLEFDHHGQADEEEIHMRM